MTEVVEKPVERGDKNIVQLLDDLKTNDFNEGGTLKKMRDLENELEDYEALTIAWWNDWSEKGKLQWELLLYKQGFDLLSFEKDTLVFQIQRKAAMNEDDFNIYKDSILKYFTWWVQSLHSMIEWEADLFETEYWVHLNFFGITEVQRHKLWNDTSTEDMNNTIFNTIKEATL